MSSLLLSFVVVAQVVTPSMPAGEAGQWEFSREERSAPLPEPLEASAKAFVLAKRKELQLPAEATLSSGTAFGTRLGGSIHFQQLLDGLEVYGAKVIVTVDNQKRVVRLSSSAFNHKQVSRRWAITAEKALQLAAREVDGALLRDDGRPYGGTRRMFFPLGDKANAAYLVHVSTLSDLENWYLFVDAADGSILWKQNRIHFSDEAEVYPVNPGGRSAGVGITPTTRVTLGRFLASRSTGFLEGEQLQTLNCCLTANCDAEPTALSKRAAGKMQTYGGVIDYDVAICDRRPRASNEKGDYVFAPVDPPRTSRPSPLEPADSDLFVEANAYYHVNNIYDFVRGLSKSTVEGLPSFKMRDEKRGKRPTVWTNALMPDFHSASQNAQGVYVSNVLERQDNAAFAPVESLDSLYVPEYKHDTDILLIYQGDKADFGYDAPVLWHEFSHGVIYSTANFMSAMVVDERSANNESGALHEAMADFFAAAFGQNPAIGTYVGPRTSSQPYIRTLENREACPTVLWGQSHQDSQHFSGALWDARQAHFLGEDTGRTFDAAIYAALVSMTPSTGFVQAARAVEAAVDDAFSATMPDAREKMQQAFAARGVTGCSKVLDLTDDNAPRPYYNILGTAEVGVVSGVSVPGPYQMKFRLPQGAKSLKVKGPYYTWGNSPMRVRLLVKKGEPITFKKAGTSLSNNADVTLTPTLSGQTMTGVANVEVGCGEEVYFTLANTGTYGRALSDLEFSVTPLDACPEPVVEPSPIPDAPNSEVLVDSLSENPTVLLAPEASGCGCHSGGSLGAFGLLLLLGLRRRASW